MGSAETIKAAVGFVEGFQQRDLLNEQTVQNDTFHRFRVISADFNIGIANHPDGGIVFNY